MEQNVSNKTELKDKLTYFYNTHKLKILLITGAFIMIVILFLFLKINSEKNNSLIAEKYIKAGLYLSENKKDQSKNLYEEIILSKNKFYSVLALYSILEKELVTDKDKILKYFILVEKINKSEKRDDLLSFKKALYLIKVGNTKEGNDLLKNLINKKSKLKTLAQEIISE